MVKQIFINLPVKDLSKTVAFWNALGFSFNPKFTNEDGAALILAPNIFAMLLTEKFFRGFIKKDVADASKSCEVINVLGVESRAEADQLADKAIAAGATSYKGPEDHGWMYVRAFQDLDGHLWEVFYGDESQAPDPSKK